MSNKKVFQELMNLDFYLGQVTEASGIVNEYIRNKIQYTVAENSPTLFMLLWASASNGFKAPEAITKFLRNGPSPAYTKTSNNARVKHK